ncbi:uncharacterized protein UTRI_10391 [Ustilago trichophora]|uniref:SCP domain-containing protein n=1 Tax=Ustilago trichophora TaxID=86804 RepID=A0A5C3E9D4_9BASI|nr:uncharacterized protein UTRI_10391 [Ustilago trichophora]
MTMTTFFRTIVIWVALSVPLTQAIDQSGWNSKEQGVWLSAKDFLEKAYSGHSANYNHGYDMHVPFTQNDAERAWEYAKDRSGPIFWTNHQDSRRSTYIMTKLPDSHPLVTDVWKLNADKVPKTAYLFWKVKKQLSGRISHELLGVDVWSVGAPTNPQYTIEEVIQNLSSRIRR